MRPARLAWGGALLTVSCAVAPPPPSHPSPLLRHQAPTFSGRTLSQNDFYSAQGEGYTMLIGFFATNCARCSEIVAAVQRIQADDPNLVVVGISEDDTEPKARRLVEGLGVHFPVLLDHEGRLARDYHVDQMPMTFVATANGSVTWVGGPEQTEDGVRAAVRGSRL